MNIATLKMEGRSGCELKIEYQDGHAMVKKHSSSLAYNYRLVKQAEKQRYFYLVNSTSTFTTPQILEISNEADKLAWFTMNYVFAEKYSDYLDQISVPEVRKLLSKLIGYFDEAFKNAPKQHVPREIFLNKFSEIRSNISRNEFIDSPYFIQVLYQLEERIPAVPLPLRTCHGDFTFSNILFSDNKIFLLDFLDSFIESPVIDIVKLRQDTCYKWSVMLEYWMPKHKSNKLSQILSYFDNEIEKYCNNLGLQEWYTFLQAVNLLRIVPYLNIRHEILFIENSLKQLLK